MTKYNGMRPKDIVVFYNQFSEISVYRPDENKMGMDQASGRLLVESAKMEKVNPLTFQE